MKTLIIDVTNHRHSGELMPVGAQIEVDDATATWMIGCGKAHLVSAPISPELTKKDK